MRGCRHTLLLLAAVFAASARAGDLLRSGSSGASGTAATGSTAASAASSGGVSAATTRGTDLLARTTQALASVRAMQAAAQALATANNLGADPNHPGLMLPNVPNGLTLGGLVPASTTDPTLWQGAAAPTQTTSGGQTAVTVTQTAQQALLTWNSFNLGRNTALTFDQSAGGANESEWIAFNRVTDPTGVPSQILGSIQAGGQVYVINQNGIIFGGSSQVNVHTLVASSLPLNDNLVQLGLLNNPDDQFLFSSLPVAAGSNGTPAYNPPAAINGQSGDVTVQAGAQLSSPTDADHVGGRIALIGPNVTNAGSISTPDGQTILAAGQQVGLTAHDSSDPSLRGLDVYIGQGGGTATNAAGGLIESPRGDVTVAGAAVNQLGAIDSSTSVTLNGRIDLLASSNAISSGGFTGLAPFFPQATGSVVFGPGSITQILPETADSDRVVGTQLALPSQINVQGQTLTMAANSTLLAPNAQVNFSAGSWELTGSGATAQDPFTYLNGQISLATGATIDVSGSAGVAASVTENIVAVQLLGPELADSPVQRDGPLRGQTIDIDIRQTGTYNGQTWVGTPLADTSGYVNLVQRDVGELTTAGGTVNLQAGQAVSLQSGSSINVSGGSIAYQGGTVQTTQVISSDGHVYDIAQATPDRTYAGIYNGSTSTADLKWGVTATSTNPQLAADYEPGYTQGGNAGAIAITAPTMTLAGSLYGQTVSGPRQIANAPVAGTLNLTFQGQDPTLAANNYPVYSPSPATIVFGATTAANGPALTLSTDLVSTDGFANLKIIDPDGKISVPAGVDLAAAPGGALNFTAANIDVEGEISSPGGGISLTADDISPYANRALASGALPVTPAPDPTRGQFTLGAAGVLSTAGTVTDDRIAANAATVQKTAGGSISVKAYSASLPAGGLVDASGGLEITAAGKPVYGAGGSIALAAGQDPNVASVLGGSLTLGSTLQAYSGGTGGSLSLLAPLVQVGGTAPNAATLTFAPGFFSTGGFSSFTLDGLGAAAANGQVVPGLVIAAGTTLAPTAQSLEAVPDQNGDGGYSLVRYTAPVGIRPPVNLSFGAIGVRDPYNTAKPLVFRGDLIVAAGVTIAADPKATVSLSGDTVTDAGSISAPGGAIRVTGAKDSAAVFLNSAQVLPTVDLQPGSSLSTAGTVLLTPNAQGYQTGTVLNGGTIAVSGNVLAEAGARLDVSGATGTLDVPAPYASATGTALASGSFGGTVYVPVREDSSGGAITLSGAQMLYIDATLAGGAGGPSAIGGSLTVSSGRFYPLGVGANAETPLDPTLTVTASGPTIPAGGAYVQGGHFAASSFAASGLASLSLNGTVQFSDPVSLSASNSLSVGSGGVISATGATSLSAPYVALGTAFAAPIPAVDQVSAFTVQGQAYHFAPTTGAGSLAVSGSLIDVGNLSLQGIGTAKLSADNGDIRGDGTFDLAGNLTLEAGAIYPPTATQFTIAAYNSTTAAGPQTGSVTVTGSGLRPLPLSGGGTLDLYAATIVQDGTLRAPLGEINLGWDGTGTAPSDLIAGKTAALPATQQLTLGSGSVTSVSAIDTITNQAVTIPYGVNLNGTSWIDPTGTDITTSGPPDKAVNLSAVSVNEQSGATVDVRGGGDLYAYRFVSGVGGTSDILASSTSFAVIPGYADAYAPYAPYSTAPLTDGLGSDAGYVSTGIKVGDRIYLQGGSGLPAGDYTVLPARYASLPGAYLVTPESGTPPVAAAAEPDGSVLVAGYRITGLGTPSAAPLNTAFDVANATVVAQRAEYDAYSADSFLKAAPTTTGSTGPRLPVDSGQLVFTATQAMSLQGAVTAQAPSGGSGGLVDINSPADIVISAPGAAPVAGALNLNSTELSGFGAESLLVGGQRTTTATGTTISASTGNLTVNNPGAPLSGTDLILVANRSLTVTAGSSVQQATGTSGASAPAVQLGSAAAAGSGDGALLRVSADPTASVTRAGTDSSTTPSLTVGAGASLTGTAVTLDSTAGTTLDPKAQISAQSLALDSGQIDVVLSNPGTVPSSSGLVISAGSLPALQSASALSLLSYSTIDFYGTGSLTAAGSLTVSAGAIRGFNTGSGTVSLGAQSILLNHASGAVAPTDGGSLSGVFSLNAQTISLGAGSLAIDRFGTVALNASNAIVGTSTGGLTTDGAVTATTPLITGTAGANESLAAQGSMNLLAAAPNPAATAVLPGLGASLTLSGSSIAADTAVVLPSGNLTLHATSGNVTVGDSGAARLDVGGTSIDDFGAIGYTAGGNLTLAADHGSVSVLAPATLNVAALAAAGNAGLLTVTAPTGQLTLGGTLLGQAGAGGTAGSFTLDAGGTPGGSTAALAQALATGGFTDAVNLRYRTGNLTVDGTFTATSFDLAADQGSITVSGTGGIDASGPTGGAIALQAAGSVILQSGARLNASGQQFSDAGKGGSVTLEAGDETNGTASATAVVDLQAGSQINLSVAAATAASASAGDLTGTLHLRAPQNAAGTDLQIQPILATITGASSVVAEGYKIYDLTGSGGAITGAVENSVLTGGQAFASNTTAIAQRLGVASGPLAGVFRLDPGAELVNLNGDLTLSQPWDLSTDRFGPNVNPSVVGSGEPGFLTLRASGNLDFAYTAGVGGGQAAWGSLSDGFGGASSYGLWDQNLLPAGSLSWSYRLVAGSDFSAANPQAVVAASALPVGWGSLILGANAPALPVQSSANRNAIVPGYYETIRTGTGDISIATAGNVELVNSLATIYTAGTQIANPTTVQSAGDFDLPQPSDPIRNSKLGATQDPLAPAQYSFEGGNVSIFAQGDIEHIKADGTADSSLELPENWLYRRGSVDPTTGLFDATHSGGEIASTTWWIDFTNFFEGVGALGGGNVSLVAGQNITNVDAVVPTNARMPKGTPNAAALSELGGGDLTVKAGGDIDGGVYYVERGTGTLQAGGSIHSNPTRAAITQFDAIALQNAHTTPDPSTWLPTTLFLGQGSFAVSASGSVLLGPVANPFLLPQGIDNNAYDKTYFSTYAPSDAVSVASLTGDVTLRDNPDDRVGSLAAWFQNVLLYDSAHSHTWATYSQPWLRVDETLIDPFATVAALMPPTLRARADNGDINLVGSLILSPSPTGTIDLLAAGSINGLQPNDETTVAGLPTQVWGTSTIDLSDADPSRIPGIASPLALSAADAAAPTVTPVDLLDNVNLLFAESGSTTGTHGVIQAKQALHAPGPLHAGDPDPIRLYATSGNISGLTLYSGKSAQVIAGADITDISLYLQNDAATDLSVVEAGRDLIAYDPDSPLRTTAQALGNALIAASGNTPGPGTGNPTAGDIQIGGPGTLEVLAGRNLNLGVGPNVGDGTGVGITSIGNARDPYLPFAGADVIAGAGLGAGAGLNAGTVNFPAFIAAFLNPASGANASRYLPDLGQLMGLAPASDAQIWQAFEGLSAQRQDDLALAIFYDVLRDAGRDDNLPAAAGYRTYAAGFAAIADLFPGNQWSGDISLTSREIKTQSGGDISLLAPGGQLTVGVDLSGNQPVDQGILTEDGGNISIFTHASVNVGTSRIFTLRGGDEIIWSSAGDIAAGASSKTVQSAPPTRVLIDPQSGDVKTDLAGLATGGGIGVLATVAGVPPGNIDLIAPGGTVNAGDAGIRVSGNLTISALQVVNASNIQVGGASVGTPSITPPSFGGALTAAAGASAATATAAADVAKSGQATAETPALPSVITVEVVGYGGGD